jgi:hypothetical protein
MDFQTIKSLAWTFGPFLASYGYSYYRNLKAQSRTNAPSRRPTPPHVQTILNILIAGAIANIILSLPYFAPENTIRFASSRLQTPSEVLWRRVAALRPDGILTGRDELLRDRLTTIDSRCLYLVYGPDALVECQFCHSDDPRSYLIYLLPSLLMPHLGNIAALGLSTSSALAGKEGSRWRMQATLAAFVFTVADVYLFYSYDHTRNARVTRANNLVVFYWNMRLLRHLGIAALQAGFAIVLWASATNRLFVTPYTAAERLERISQQLQVAGGKTTAAGIVSNAVARDPQLRQKHDQYWQQETVAMRDIMSDEQVVQAVRAARSSGRINVEAMERDARTYAEGLVAAS